MSVPCRHSIATVPDGDDSTVCMVMLCLHAATWHALRKATWYSYRTAGSVDLGSRKVIAVRRRRDDPDGGKG